MEKPISTTSRTKMIAQATLPEVLPKPLPELEPCPVCFNDDLSSLKRLNGCGHSVCGDCKFGLYAAQNQFVNWMKVFRKDNKRIKLKLMKCPICRTIEKPTLELLKENSRLGFVGICNLVNPLLPCQNSGCTRKCRTRDRCPNHHAVPCCARHSGCDQCH